MNIFKRFKFITLKSLLIGKKMQLFNNETSNGFHANSYETTINSKEYKLNKKPLSSADVEYTLEDLNWNYLSEKDLIDEE